MKNRKAKAVEIISSIFILLFVYAAVSKFRYYTRFIEQLDDSPLLSYNQAEILAWLVPGVELIIVVMLAMPLLRKVGLYASSILMMMFTIYIVAVLRLDEDIPCSCGGVLEGMGWTEHLIFNVAFVMLGLVGVFLDSNPKPETSGLEESKLNKNQSNLAGNLVRPNPRKV